MYMVAPLDLHFSILYDVLKKHVAEDADYKVSDFKLPAYIIGSSVCHLSYNLAGYYILYYCNGHQTCG